VKAIRAVQLQKLFLNTPARIDFTKDWAQRNASKPGVRFLPLLDGLVIGEKPPVVIGHKISQRFAGYYRRKSREAFVAVIPGGKVLGEYANMLITPDNRLLADVSREFGAQGGKKAADFSIFHNRMRMPPKEWLAGNTAVISTCGSNNFHHWNYDVLPRLYLLQKAGVLDTIDHFIINYKAIPFQMEGLDRLGIDRSKIIDPQLRPAFFLEAEYLYVPSLTQDLGTITPWVLEFLRGTFLPKGAAGKAIPEKKIFISRRNAPTRKIVNEKEVMDEIFRRGFIEFIPEDHSMEATAGHFSEAGSIISVHGSGLSNLPFVSPGARVLDIMAPYHPDP